MFPGMRTIVFIGGLPSDKAVFALVDAKSIGSLFDSHSLYLWGLSLVKTTTEVRVTAL